MKNHSKKRVGGDLEQVRRVTQQPYINRAAKRDNANRTPKDHKPGWFVVQRHAQADTATLWFVPSACEAFAGQIVNDCNGSFKSAASLLEAQVPVPLVHGVIETINP